MALTNNPFLEKLQQSNMLMLQDAREYREHERQQALQDKQFARQQQEFDRRNEIAEQQTREGRKFSLLSGFALNKNLTPESRQEAAKLAMSGDLGMLNPQFQPQFSPEDPAKQPVVISADTHPYVAKHFPLLVGKELMPQYLEWARNNAIEREKALQHSRTSGKRTNLPSGKAQVQALDDQIKQIRAQRAQLKEDRPIGGFSPEEQQQIDQQLAQLTDRENQLQSMRLNAASGRLFEPQQLSQFLYGGQTPGGMDPEQLLNTVREFAPNLLQPPAATATNENLSAADVIGGKQTAMPEQFGPALPSNLLDSAQFNMLGGSTASVERKIPKQAHNRVKAIESAAAELKALFESNPEIAKQLRERNAGSR